MEKISGKISGIPSAARMGRNGSAIPAISFLHPALAESGAPDFVSWHGGT
jgi:hypothetical protein